ncbi:MAG: ParB/RepB/Spo0J family partition protein [Bacteroidota bacterium]|nr:ParB/RepB/Spo0J family partition protein [Bacteroidota bacterium]MDP3147303.1 ParB/RepB/Spo0J family partition protein [Bacteroidota bacterium]MDP3557323.1 ParB/RepB/Spo0J family partition protein [Bacteroidota bacterium]
MSNNKKPALGRGLSALLENARTDITSKHMGEGAPTVNSVSTISIKSIEANPFQPRTNFEETALQELSDSIKQHGIIQPLTVRKLGYDRYQLISGERRFRASQLAGLTDVPAYIRVADDQAMLEMALVENIQREDLDPIEVSLSYKRLIDECDLTQEQLSEKVGKQRSTVTNFLRLLKLPAPIQKALRDQEITMGHAKALINIDNEDRQLAIFALALEQELSVRQIEELARGEKLKVTPKVSRVERPLTIEDKTIAKKLEKIFNKSYSFKRNAKGGGNLTLSFSNDKELQHIISFFGIE